MEKFDGTPYEGKLSRTVWGGGKAGDYIKCLPIAPEMGNSYPINLNLWDAIHPGATLATVEKTTFLKLSSKLVRRVFMSLTSSLLIAKMKETLICPLSSTCTVIRVSFLVIPRKSVRSCFALFVVS